ncbi:MAG TPA: YhjD/YihY/BrkB family envelope integrity protein, partial [Gaiellales bacterium]|nr:YhjD/YihY/BrkB family envelope integrity protein [Gaiellales bacterium]
MTGPSSSRRVEAARRWLANSLGGLGYRRSREIDLDTHALALCAQQVLCTAPLIVAMGAVLQRLTGHGAAYFIDRFFGLHGESADAVDKLFARTTSISTSSLVIALIISVVFSTGVAAVQQRAFERIWTLPRIISVRSYGRQLAWAVMLGTFSSLMLGLGRVGRELTEALGVTAIMCIAIVQGAVTFLFYWWSQYWLLAGRVTWRALLPGAVAVGVLTTIMFRLTRVIMPPEMTWPVHAYGLIGGVFVMSVWLMILCVVIFAGTLFGALVSERRAEAARRRGEAAGTESDAASESPLTVAGLDSAGDAPPKKELTRPL